MEADRDDKFGPAIILALGKLQSLTNPNSLELPGILFLSLPVAPGGSLSGMSLQKLGVCSGCQAMVFASPQINSASLLEHYLCWRPEQVAGMLG